MTAPEPSIIELITSVLTRMDKQDADMEYVKREVREISAQAKITNGRVTQLEIERITQAAVRADREHREDKAKLSRLTLACALLGGPVSAVVSLVLTLMFLN